MCVDGRWYHSLNIIGLIIMWILGCASDAGAVIALRCTPYIGTVVVRLLYHSLGIIAEEP